MTSPKELFTALIPELTTMANAAFRNLGPEARAEAVQNTMALTWKMFHSLIGQGRADEPGVVKSCLWYSIKQTRAGRKAQGCSAKKAKDVLDSAGRGRVKFERVELGQFVAADTPVPEQVAFRLDVPPFLATLTARQRRLAGDLMGGLTTTEAAARHGVTPGAVSQFRRRFKFLYEEFMAG